MLRCQALTRRKTICPNLDATYDTGSGSLRCHIHHSNSRYRRQVESRRDNRATRKAECEVRHAKRG